MIVQTKTNTITITFSSDEMVLIDWITATYGTNEFQALLARFLEQKQTQMNETNKSTFWDTVKDHPDVIEAAIDMVKAKANP